MSTTSPRRLSIALALALLAGGAMPQQAPAPTEPRAPEADPLQREQIVEDHILFPLDIRSLVASTLTRVALLRTRVVPSPTLDDFESTAWAIHIAQRLMPDDVQLVRLEREARAAAAQYDRVTELQARVLQLDPADTVAQLALLNSNIAKQQTADARLALYERILGPAGDQLDAAVRSRLALDAALLAREQGDESRAADLLLLATELDATNKQAATLFAAYFLPLASRPLDRVELLANVWLADPLDPGAAENLMGELVRTGAFQAADRVFAMHERLIVLRGENLFDIDRFMQRTTILWNAFGPATAIEYLSNVEDKAREFDERKRARQIEDGFEPGPRPAGYLVPSLEALRLAVHVARQDRARSTQAIEAMAEATERVIDVVLEEGDLEISDLDLERVRIENGLTLLWSRLLSGEQIPSARRQYADLRERAAAIEQPLTPDAIRRFDGWFLVYDGELDRAREQLEPLADAGDLQAGWALGTAAQLEGDSTEAARRFAALALRAPATAIGSAARERVELLLGQDIAPPPEVQEVEDYIAELAPWLESFIVDPSSYLDLRLDFNTSAIELIGPMRATLTLRNRLNFPIALGVGAPVRDQVMALSRLEVAGQDLDQLVRPSIISTATRLRLAPREQFEVEVDLRRDNLGEISDRFAEGRGTARCRVLHHFVLGPTGQPVDGPFSLSAQSPEILVRLGVEAGLTDEQIAAELAAGNTRRTLDLAIAAASRIGAVINAQAARDFGARNLLVDIEPPSPEEIRQEADTLDTLRRAIIARTPRLGPLEQTHVIIRMSQASDLGTLIGDDLARSGLDLESPYVLAALMLSGEAQAIELGLGSADADVRELAESLQRASVAAPDEP
ncbi:MAG: hypothetical protein AAGI30_12110 [Planctomycetota bacterium]